MPFGLAVKNGENILGMYSSSDPGSVVLDVDASMRPRPRARAAAVDAKIRLHAGREPDLALRPPDSRETAWTAFCTRFRNSWVRASGSPRTAGKARIVEMTMRVACRRALSSASAIT